jgi:hypothetical protein
LTVTAGLSETVTLSVDASTLPGGSTKQVTLEISSNDPDEAIKNVAVTLNVMNARAYLPLVMRQ